ncbi:cytochrome oxidase c subunit VIb-domain-containing protein [Flagelloscypha sp. PMI_526]|nr:cytochrome oxidase c subunit VIb-domain-containing protein [Flagelloscypha sp. PMI_526]
MARWFSGWGSKTEEPDALTKGGRQMCWDNRDAYFACLDAKKIVKPGEEGSACDAEKKEYVGSCAKSWIHYFNQRRIIADAQKDQLAAANLGPPPNPVR